jgi:predicted nuclease of predicted toxin-antitoxin system
LKFKTDENLPEEAARLLEEAGHDASTILEESMGGDPDPDVASVCLAEGRALVTLDLGFADIRAYPPEQYPGLIVLRPGRQSKTRVVAIVGKLPPLLDTERIVGRLWIVEEDRVRIRATNE